MKTWKIHRAVYKVSDFISWQKQGNLILNPKFQRRSVWSPGAKSFLLDTILKDLPIPIIILRELRTDLQTFEPKREVVDGQQRLRAIISFISPNIVKNYNEKKDSFTIQKNHNSEVANMKFSELPEDIKYRILDYEFFVHILPAQVADREVLEIFSRMNSTGLKLKPQELRNAKYFGEFKTTMYDLGLEQYERWVDWGIFRDSNIARMDEIELVNDFSILILNGLSARKPASIDKYYEKYDSEFKEKTELSKRFRTIMDSIEQIFGTEIKSTLYKKSALFYALFAIVYDQQYGLKSALIRKTHNSVNISKLKKELLQLNEKIEREEVPIEVLRSYTKGTNNIDSRKILFDFLKEGLK